jgi:hypothetical protein
VNNSFYKFVRYNRYMLCKLSEFIQIKNGLSCETLLRDHQYGPKRVRVSKRVKSINKRVSGRAQPQRSDQAPLIRLIWHCFSRHPQPFRDLAELDGSVLIGYPSGSTSQPTFLFGIVGLRFAFGLLKIMNVNGPSMVSLIPWPY